MIQRIQTIYLLLAFVATAVLPFALPSWKLENGQDFYFMLDQVLYCNFLT
jgi:hypothetical protein